MMSRSLRLLAVAALGVCTLIAAGCGASSPPERTGVLVTIITPDTITDPEVALDGRHLVMTPVDLDAAAAQRVYVHLPQRGTTPQAADPMWGKMAAAGARVVVLAYNPAAPDDAASFDLSTSAETQLAALLAHLADTAPGDGWNPFVTDGAVDWSRVTISGNRDGADIALAVANARPVARTVLIAGPVAAPTSPTNTDPTRFSFAHADDYFEGDQQFALNDAGVSPDVVEIATNAELESITSGNRFLSTMPLVDGFNGRNDWQNLRYESLWQYLCCS